jgi:hypothetical protein
MNPIDALTFFFIKALFLFSHPVIEKYKIIYLFDENYRHTVGIHWIRGRDNKHFLRGGNGANCSSDIIG